VKKHKRNADGEHTPLIFLGTHLNGAPQLVQNIPDIIQAETGPVFRGGGPEKNLKYIGKVVFRNSDAVVGHPDNRLVGTD